MHPFSPFGSNQNPPNGGGAPDPNAPSPPQVYPYFLFFFLSISLYQVSFSYYHHNIYILLLHQVSAFLPFPINQPHQFNLTSASNTVMAMAMFNRNPIMQFGLGALAAMKLVGQGTNMQPNMGFQMQGPMQNLNMLVALQSASNMIQGLNPMVVSNPILQQITSGFGVPQANQGSAQPVFSGALLPRTNMV
jgi:hypothetical protein